MTYIQVPDMNDSISFIEIDGAEYWLRFTYNELYDYWSFGIYDDQEEPIIAMTRIVPNFPLMHFYEAHGLPDGVFGCLCDSENVGRYAFLNDEATFVYIPWSEMEEAGLTEES